MKKKQMQVIDENGNSVPNESSKRVVTGVLCILLGEFGIHKFILGYTKEGFLQIALSILTCGIGGLIEGIIYLTKTPNFIHNKKPEQINVLA